MTLLGFVRRAAIGLGVLSALLGRPAGLQADEINWVGNQSGCDALGGFGSFHDGINWLNFEPAGEDDVASFGKFTARQEIRYLYFGDTQTSYSGPCSEPFIPAADAVTAGLSISAGSWTFDFGPSQPGGASGSYRVTQGFYIGGNDDPGDPTSRNASLALRDGTFTTPGALIGSPELGARGEIDLSGGEARWVLETEGREDLSIAFGSVTVSDGASVVMSSGSTAVGRGQDAVGSLVIDGAGSTFTFTGERGGEVLAGFEGGTGSITVRDGGRLESVGQVGVGVFSGSEGTVRVTTDGTLVTDRELIVGGLGGKGEVVVGGPLASGTVESRDGVIGQTAGSEGEVTLRGSSAWTIVDSLGVGGSFHSAGGDGLLTVADSATVAVGSALAIWDGGRVVLSGDGKVVVGAVDPESAAVQALTVGDGGLVMATGTLDGDLHVEDGGIFHVGHSPGVFSVLGDFIQSGSGRSVFEIGGLLPGTGYDQLLVDGNVLLGGILEIRFINGFALGPGQRFDLILATGLLDLGGATIQVSGLSTDLSYRFDQEGGRFSLSVVPEPATWLMTLVGGAALGAVRLRGRRPSTASR